MMIAANITVEVVIAPAIVIAGVQSILPPNVRAKKLDIENASAAFELTDFRLSEVELDHIIG